MEWKFKYKEEKEKREMEGREGRKEGNWNCVDGAKEGKRKVI